MPKVSIIITAYNCENTINRCIDSVINQTNQDFELIIVNDGSTDNTELAVLNYKESLGAKLKYYYKENTGVADTRNFGLEKSTGDYIMYIDCDDYIDKNLLLKLENYMEEQIDVIKYKMIKVDVQDKELERIDGPVFEETSGQAAFNELFYQDVLIDSPCIYLIKKEYLLANNFRFPYGTYHEDFAILPIIIANAASMVSTDVYGYYYVQTENSIMREENKEKTINKMQDSFMHYDNMLKTIENQNLSKFTKQNMKIYYTNSILVKIKELPKELKNDFIKEFKKRKMVKNIRIRNVKQLVKRLILQLSVNMYLKLK